MLRYPTCVIEKLPVCRNSFVEYYEDSIERRIHVLLFPKCDQTIKSLSYNSLKVKSLYNYQDIVLYKNINRVTSSHQSNQNLCLAMVSKRRNPHQTLLVGYLSRRLVSPDQLSANLSQTGATPRPSSGPYMKGERKGRHMVDVKGTISLLFISC